jgi:2-amino-4-hydroxy-6-hydroxymethyldihydropteridine diphosphokinase
LKTIYLSLGSNSGDRLENLARARERLAAADIRILRVSEVYETAPRDVPAQPWFLNQVIEAESALLPRQLLSRLQKIERDMGRKRTVAKGPRIIDIDIVLFGESVISMPDLEIPHPRMMERRFVLEPLAELAPELRHPILNRSVREMLAKVADQQARRFSGNR